MVCISGQRRFKTAINGFHKQSVLDYIGELNRYITSSEQRSGDRIRELERQNAELFEQMRAAGESMAASEAETAAEPGRELLEQENMRLKAAVEELQADNGELLARCERLLHDSDEYRRKADIYDSSVRQISDALIKARQDADDIIEKAVREANSIKEHIRRELQRAGHAYDAFRMEMDRLKGGTLDMADSMRTQIMQLDQTICEIRDELFLADRLKGSE